MIRKDPQQIDKRSLYRLLTGTIVPRPIAVVSTMDKHGNVNLAPFSFFNIASIDPPVLLFSPLHRMRSNTTKDTFNNLKEHDELVINLLTYEHAEQISLAGGEYEPGVNEFDKTGLTLSATEKVRPPAVAEAYASFECKLHDIISLGDEGGAGEIVLARIVLAHFREAIFDSEGIVDPRLFTAVARLGSNYYARITEDSLFEIEKSSDKLGIGWDALPAFVRNSKDLTANEVSMLASISELPENLAKLNAPKDAQALMKAVKQLLGEKRIIDAWKLLISESM